jgi:hypothetical protein
MLVRCAGKEEANEAIRALMRIRMRMAGLADWNFHWSNPHPGNQRTTPDQVKQWLDTQWKHAAKLDRNAIVPPDKHEWFDTKVAIYELWFVPEWPTSAITARRLNNDGTFQSHEKWVARLWESIQKYGIKDPVFAYGHHVPSQVVFGQRPEELARVVLGNNRVAIAKHHGIKTIPVVTTVDRGKKPPFEGRKISFEEYHDVFMGHRADLWCSPEDIYLVHPPTVFYDEKDGGNLKPCPL